MTPTSIRETDLPKPSQNKVRHKMRFTVLLWLGSPWPRWLSQVAQSIVEAQVAMSDWHLTRASARETGA